jgi:hypothetical protein
MNGRTITKDELLALIADVPGDKPFLIYVPETGDYMNVELTEEDVANAMSPGEESAIAFTALDNFDTRQW